MKLRSVATSSLVCAFIALSAVLAAAQHKALYAPHRAGSAPPTVQAGNTAAPVEVPPSGATWTKGTNAPPVSMGSMLLLTDGRVLVHSEPNCSGCVGSYAQWYTLTPDNTGSYINGTWKQMASLPSGYTPLFFGSAVLSDGKVVVQGGEYNCPLNNCSGVWQSLGAIYDPAANTWTATTPPSGTTNIGDAQSVVLPDGTWMLAECCAVSFGDSTFPRYYYFNESTLTFTLKASSSDGKNDENDEEGWNLMPDGSLLTVDAYTSNTVLTGTNSEIYDPSTNKWSTAGSTINQLWDSNCGSGGGSDEVGPAVLRPDGTVFATGASDCRAGHTAVYSISAGTWSTGPDFPNSDAANDAPAALEINGNVIVEASPFSGTFSSPAKFYEWDGTNLNSFPAPPNAANTPSFAGHLLVLPNGQVMYTDFTKDVEFLTSTGTFSAAWQPTITSVSSTLAPGSTNNAISGTQFNGLSQANAYGDDFQDATNYPLVRIVNNATGHVFYCKTHNHSTMAVATGGTTVSTSFDVPSTIETGASELVVVANGIPSAATAVTISGSSKTPTTTTVTSSLNPSTFGQKVTFTATVTPVNSPAPTGTVAFTADTVAIKGCTAVKLSNTGIAKCTTAGLKAGSHSIVATYSGDSNYLGSTSSALSQVVNKASTTTALVSSANPSSVGQQVTFTATVTPTVGGTVKFTNNGATITGCGGVALVSGSAACNVTFTKTGTFSIVGKYNGNPNYAGSTSNTVSQVVH